MRVNQIKFPRASAYITKHGVKALQVLVMVLAVSAKETNCIKYFPTCGPYLNGQAQTELFELIKTLIRSLRDRCYL